MWESISLRLETPSPRYFCVYTINKKPLFANTYELRKASEAAQGQHHTFPSSPIALYFVVWTFSLIRLLLLFLFSPTPL